MKGASLLLLSALTLYSSRAAAEAPIVLEKWGRFHTHITTYMPNPSPPKGKRVKWVPKVSLVLKVTSPESDDVILLQHYQGGRKWGKQQVCQIPSHGRIERRIAGKSAGYYLVAATCTLDVKRAISKAGKFKVKVGYKQTGAGKIHKNLATFSYTVKKFNLVIAGKRGAIKGFYVDHDFRMGEAWLYQRGDGQVQIWSWFKYNRTTAAHVRGARLRCFVKGKKMKFFDNPTRRTEVYFNHYYANAKHRRTTWGLWYWWTGTVPGAKNGLDWLKKNPGQYRCTLTQAGNIAREFTFTVNADGSLAYASCKKASGPRTVKDEYAIKMVFKRGADLKFNKGAIKRGALYGRKRPRGCPP